MTALQTLDIGGTMDMPTFDYSTAADGPRADEHTSIEPAERPVFESACASTAQQENSSKFDYIVTHVDRARRAPHHRERQRIDRATGELIELRLYPHGRRARRDRLVAAGAHPPHIRALRRVIESASASTAPQENSSNFAYILTGAVLGVIALLLLALTLLIFGLFDAAYSSPGHMGDGLSYYESHTLDRDAERPDADLDGFVDA